MNTLNCDCHNRQPAYLPSPGFSASGQRTTAFQSSSRTNAEITLFTSENDKITLTFGAKESLFQASYDRFGRQSDGSRFHQQGQVFSDQSSFRMGLTVQGDLNAREMADLSKALKSIGKILKGFVQGDSMKSRLESNKILKLDTIDGLEAQMHYSQRTRTTQTTLGRIQDKGPGSHQSERPAHRDRKMDALVEHMRNRLTQVQRQPKDWRQVLDQWFERLQSNFAAEDGPNDKRDQTVRDIQSALNRQMELVDDEEAGKSAF